MKIGSLIPGILVFGLMFNRILAQNNGQGQIVERMINTYTYYVVQNITLETLAVKFPFLSQIAKNATNDWDRQFLISIQNIDKILSDSLGTKWSDEKKNIIHKFSGTDYSSITEDEARKYIDLVFQRSLGKMQPPILETLLIYKPGYMEHPENEFTDGYTGEFNTQNFKKSIGINLKLLYPRTWLVIPGNSKSGFLQKYVSNYGLGDLILEFQIENKHKEIPLKSIETLLSEPSLKKTITPNDSLVEYSEATKIDNLPSASIKFLRKEVNEPNPIFTLFDEYHSYYKNFHIILTFKYTGKGTAETFKIEEINQKLIKRIILNIVVLNQWEQKRF